MKVRIPLVQHFSGSAECPLPIVTLRVRDALGILVPMRFRVDTAADCTAVPTTIAALFGISFQRARASDALGMVGTARKYRDRLRVVIGGREHSWPCDFVEAPAQSSQRHSTLPPSVLGRAGFLDEYALSIDDGFLIITRLGPIRRLCRRGLRSIWSLTGQIHPVDKPL
jgi:hypothetical protein